jgi:hypothetical protein
MTRDNGLCTSNQEWSKTRMETSICFDKKGNGVIAYYLFSIRLCPLLNSHRHYMCCCYRCSLRHICVSQVNNDNVHQSPKVVSSDNDIHLSSNVTKEKVGDLPLNMCSILQNNSYDSIPKCVMGCCTLTPIGAPKQMGT